MKNHSSFGLESPRTAKDIWDLPLPSAALPRLVINRLASASGLGSGTGAHARNQLHATVAK
ncbi:MAG: hypothetical protein IKG18_02575 [Atopobiaceae bacterium]|nr:hypothetical protein [Atopobiaceae bacterium]